jgi:hypothetical protein
MIAKSTFPLIFLILLKFQSFSQVASTNIAISHYETIKNTVETYVNNEIEIWQLQGRYENTEDYLSRVSTRNRNKKINELTTNKINELAEEVIHLTISTLEYDPDNEVYKLTFVGLPAIYFNVPVANQEASELDENRIQLLYKSANYTLTESGFALLNLTIQNPVNWKSYQYNYDENLTFKQNKVHLNFERVKFKTDDIIPGTNETFDDISIVEDINIDEDLPKTKMSQPNAVAIVIGNKDYFKTGSVDYALKDAKSIKDYLIYSLGFKEGNVIYRENITKSNFEELFGTKEVIEGKLYNMIKQDISDVVIYYSGHGAPGLKNFKGYLIPVECDPSYIELGGYSLETLYANLARLPAKSITVIVDACFSGEDIYTGISSVLPKVTNPAFAMKNGVLITSSKSSEPSNWYIDEEHGLFTYFFLRALKEKDISDENRDGQLTFQEIYNYISSPTEGIPYYARNYYNKEQHPTIQGATDRVFIDY